MPNIKTVIHNKDGTVNVFDKNDKKVPSLEGKYGDVKTKILRDASGDVKFKFGNKVISRSSF